MLGVFDSTTYYLLALACADIRSKIILQALANINHIF